MVEPLDAQWLPEDRMVDTSRKAPHVRTLVGGAHWLLEEDGKGTLRHFATDHIDMPATRAANQGKRREPLLTRYLDALERNDGRPVTESVKTPRFWTETVAEIRFWVSQWRK